MNKLCVTKQGLGWLHQPDVQDPEFQRSLSNSKRNLSLPQLLSTARISQKQQLTSRLSQMTLKLKDLQSKGLRKIIIEKQDKHLAKVLAEEFKDRRMYIRGMVPQLVKKTRDGMKFGNVHSRLQRGKAYAHQLDSNFDKRFTFRVPKKVEE